MASIAREGPGAPQDFGTIEFRTTGTWSAGELAHAIAAVDGSYCALALAERIGAEREREVQWARRQFDRRDWPYYATTGPSEEIIDRCLDDPRTFLNKDSELILIRIHLASDGGFSFKGLGSPINALRELWRDLWYRNGINRKKGQQALRAGDQRLAMGELELVRERLRLMSEFGLTHEELDRLAKKTLDHVANVRQLAEDNRLALGPGPDTGPAEWNSEPSPSPLPTARVITNPPDDDPDTGRNG